MDQSISKTDRYDKVYMEMASAVSSLSFDTDKKVGAVLVDSNLQIVATGFNGTPRGFHNECKDTKGKTKPEVIHAEMNALIQCARNNASPVGTTLYVTLAPCIECAKHLIQAGVSRVVYMDDWKDDSGMQLLKAGGIHVRKFTNSSRLH